MAEDCECVPFTVGIPVSEEELHGFGHDVEVDLDMSMSSSPAVGYAIPAASATAYSYLPTTATATATAATDSQQIYPHHISEGDCDFEATSCAHAQEFYNDFELMDILAEAIDHFDEPDEANGNFNVNALNLIADEVETVKSDHEEANAPVAFPITSSTPRAHGFLMTTAPLTYAVPKEQYLYGTDFYSKDADSYYSVLPENCVEAVATYYHPPSYSSTFAGHVLVQPASANVTAANTNATTSADSVAQAQAAITATTTSTIPALVTPAVNTTGNLEYGLKKLDSPYFMQTTTTVGSDWMHSHLIPLKRQMATLYVGPNTQTNGTMISSTVGRSTVLPLSSTKITAATITCSLTKWKEERRQQAILRWKVKRMKRKEKEAQEWNEKNVKQHQRHNSGLEPLSARQQAAAKRVREGGKFKKAQVKWTSVTELSK